MNGLLIQFMVDGKALEHSNHPVKSLRFDWFEYYAGHVLRSEKNAK